MLPQARASDESTPLAWDDADAGLLRSPSLTLFGFFTSSRLVHAATVTTRASAPSHGLPVPRTPRSDVAVIVFMASPLLPGLEAEPHGEGVAPRQRQAERVDGFPEVL